MLVLRYGSPLSGARSAPCQAKDLALLAEDDDYLLVMKKAAHFCTALSIICRLIALRHRLLHVLIDLVEEPCR